MPAELLIPILLFIVLAGVIAIALRRIGGLVAESRETTAFRRSVEDLAGRIDTTLGDIISRVDALRRQQIEADEIAEPLDKALEALLGFSEEARGLGGPPIVAGPKAAFAAEIDRADRALQMVEHGASILGSVSSGQRFAEAQTAIKRGYLNVIHARDAIARHAREISLQRSPEEARWLSRRPPENAAESESRR
jgi:hypothetical protein